jgi:hypothetical protein
MVMLAATYKKKNLVFCAGDAEMPANSIYPAGSSK